MANRTVYPTIQFQPGDSDATRIEKLRRLMQQVEELRNAGVTGDTGPAGPAGAAGAAGAAGPAGAAGATGPKGTQGLAGPPGIDGDPGEDGSPGPPGQPGVAGPTGAAGPMGNPGVDGGDGADGDLGPPGAQGLPGSTGAVGPVGPAVYMEAEPGQDGDFGPPGIPGAAGATGAVGPIGAAVYMEAEPGEQGETGLPGIQGPTGAVGPVGAAVYMEAEPGEQGDLGPTGPQGLTGAIGPVGPAVYMEADPGQDGDQGPPGVAGVAGVAGVPGPQGVATYLEAEPASDGDMGPPGPVGPIGPTGSVGPIGVAVYMEAEPGEQGDLGPVGPQGLAGAQGPPGPALYDLDTWAPEEHFYTPWMDNASSPDWSGSHRFLLAASAATNTYPIRITSVTPGIQFEETDQAADSTKWDLVVNSLKMQLRAVTDAGVTRPWLVITRTIGAITDLSFGNASAGNNPTYQFLGTGLTTHNGPVALVKALGTGPTPDYGSPGQVLISNGPNSPPVWGSAPGMGMSMMDDYSTEDVIVPIAPPVTPFGAGVAIVDFGAFPGASDTSLAVTGLPAITANGAVVASITPKASTDHSADEHWAETIGVSAGNIVAGTGFTIYAKNTGVGDTRLYGKWNVAYNWVA